MKNGNLGRFALGLLGLAVSVYVIGYAWRASQSRKNTSPFNPADVMSDDKLAEMDAIRRRYNRAELLNPDGSLDGVYNLKKG